MACYDFGLVVEPKDLIEYLIKETLFAGRNQFTVNKINFRKVFCLLFCALSIYLKIRFVKSVQTRIFFWSVFFLYSDWIQSIQSEYRKIRTRKNSVFGHFSRSDLLANFIALIYKLYEFNLKIMVLSSIKMMLRISLMWNKFYWS